MSEPTSEWPSTPICIIGYSGPQWNAYALRVEVTGNTICLLIMGLLVVKNHDDQTCFNCDDEDEEDDEEEEEQEQVEEEKEEQCLRMMMMMRW